MNSIIDNQSGNTLQLAIEKITGGSKELCIATAFFSLDALGLISKNLHECESVRILFGDDANRTQRAKLMIRLRSDSDEALCKERLNDPTLDALRTVDKLFAFGRVQARCYTMRKFHAKAYLATRDQYPQQLGILGSGNFTRPGLTQNLELNVELVVNQPEELREWFEARWAEAVEDDVTELVREEIKRQIDLYDPYAIYQKALLAWGHHYQGGIEAEDGLLLKSILDPHQSLGYRRALEILDREHGVMVCDGVGLGKSFIALALMEHYCRAKKNVLLIAPKSIMESSWNEYLGQYLVDYRDPYGTISEKFMTDLGFDASEEAETESALKKRKQFEKLAERADVIVVDESHNFRRTHVQRYANLKSLTRSLSMLPGQRKKVILLTATPINTAYQDLSAQLTLISQEHGLLAGYQTSQINSAARNADSEAKDREVEQLTMNFDNLLNANDHVLNKLLEAVVIQRKRTTCIALAKAAGKDLIFPIRETPTQLDYKLSNMWKQVVRLAHKRFAPTAAFLKAMKREYKKADEQKVELKVLKMPAKTEGIKFAAFLPEQYRTAGPVGKRSYQVEVFLAGLVFANTMKQLESSPAAFQGILQSLGTSLVVRLKYVFGEAADKDIEAHYEWVRTPINTLTLTDDESDLESGENTEVNGAELDAWLEKAIDSRHLNKKLSEFKEDCFNVAKWRRDILHDLEYLKEIHRATLEAREFPDYKLEKVTQILRDRLARNQRVVVFTQSQRTSFYLEKSLADNLPGAHVARIDSNVKQETRADVLHAFCPKYNAKPLKSSRQKVDILICTDVLSEGVNMQEAECILNYDIHWNPVRLIQRIGRVDRRLDPKKNPLPHSFSIINCLPPKDIDEIIQLVDAVENRTTQISRTLGIDQAFFKSTDPAGTLKEFNSALDGEMSAIDHANERFITAIANPDPETLKQVEEMPPGAFGVWDGAPVNGVFALFEMATTEKLSPEDEEHFRAVIGMPVLAVETANGVELDAAAALDLLSSTIKGEHSSNPEDPAQTKAALGRIKNHINQSFRSTNLVATIQPKLICFMEMRN